MGRDEEIRNKKRIVGEKANISYSSVDDFFNGRSNGEKKHKYNYVLYLDDNPEVAIERDRYSKEKISDFIDFKCISSILDIGCGIGRMGELFCQNGVFYYGIDANAKFIEMANENLSAYKNKKLAVGNLLDIENVLCNNSIDKEVFDVILFVGVLMYVNDDDAKKLLQSISDRVNQSGGMVIFIESMSDTERLSLDGIYSDELKQNYSAIYRSEKEFIDMMQSALGEKLCLVANEIMDYSDGMQKKRDLVTREHLVVWKWKK